MNPQVRSLVYQSHNRYLVQKFNLKWRLLSSQYTKLNITVHKIVEQQCAPTAENYANLSTYNPRERKQTEINLKIAIV